MSDDIVFNRKGGHYFACLAGTPTVSCSLTPFYSLDERFVWFRFDRRGLSLTDSFLMSCSWKLFLLIRYLVLWVRSAFPSIWSVSHAVGFVSCSKRHTKSHTLCRRCGCRAFHRQHKSAFLHLFSRRYLTLHSLVLVLLPHSLS